MQKVRRHFIIKTSTAYRVTNSSLFHYVNTILFKLSFTVLFAIAKFIILSLRGWFPFVPTSLLSSYSIKVIYYIYLCFCSLFLRIKTNPRPLKKKITDPARVRLFFFLGARSGPRSYFYYLKIIIKTAGAGGKSNILPSISN